MNETFCLTIINKSLVSLHNLEDSVAFQYIRCRFKMYIVNSFTPNIHTTKGVHGSLIFINTGRRSKTAIIMSLRNKKSKQILAFPSQSSSHPVIQPAEYSWHHNFTSTPIKYQPGALLSCKITGSTCITLWKKKIDSSSTICELSRPGILSFTTKPINI